MNTTRGPGHRPFEHGHLDQQAPDPLGGLHRHLQAHVGPERHPTDDRLVDAELVEQGDDVTGVGVHAVGRRVPGLVGPPVTGQVEQDDLEPSLGQVGGQASAQLVVEEDAVEEHEHAWPLAVALVLEAQPLDLEGALLEGTALEQSRDPRDRRPAQHGRDGPFDHPRLGDVIAGVGGVADRPGRARNSRKAEPAPHRRHAPDDTRVPSRGAARRARAGPRTVNPVPVRSAGASGSRPATGPTRCGPGAPGRPGPGRPAPRWTAGR